MVRILAIALAGMFATGAQAAEKRPPKDPQERICRADKETGSRIAARKTCMTRAEWDELARESRKEMDRARIDRRQRD